MNLPIIYQADSYKFSHYEMFPPHTTKNVSYIESRGISEDFGIPLDSKIVFFGLQAFIKETLLPHVTKQHVDAVEEMIIAHGLPFNRTDWDIIVDEYDGCLPVEIQAIPEGSLIDPKVVMLQVMNTDPRFAWAASFVETALLRAIWYPSTVATLSRAVKQNIDFYNRMTSDIPDAIIDFQLHDFGARGVSSSQSAQLGGLAHLVNFQGSDTVEALFAAQALYGQHNPAAFSVPAAEHSTIISWGEDHELDAFRHIVDKNKGKIVSVVSDSWDIFNAVDNLWPQLKDDLKANGTTLVVRPDSGDPTETVMRVLYSLKDSFGSTRNSKNCHVLDGVRVIQGDGVNPQEIDKILSTMTNEGFSSENIVFGMGGALLQKVNRDSLKFAMKTNYVEIDGEGRDVSKNPVDAPWKASKAGIQWTYEDANGDLKSSAVYDGMYVQNNLLQPVYSNGRLLRDITLTEVRANAAI
jgi:nicotinamide phosphoribosyltransferase